MKRGIVSYDITINRYRTKLSKLLSGFGERVQFSVFEFNLEEILYKEMIEKILYWIRVIKKIGMII